MFLTDEVNETVRKSLNRLGKLIGLIKYILLNLVNLYAARLSHVSRDTTDSSTTDVAFFDWLKQSYLR